MKEYNVKLYDNFSQPHNIKVACDKEYDIDNVIALPTFKYLNLSNLKSYNVFDLNNLSYSSLKSQLDKFDTSRPTFLYIDDVTKYIQDYECIVSFCVDYRIVVIANAGSTLEEMGRCDKQFGMTPVGLLEDYGVLDLEPIILGGANLDKDDYEKLSYYNATLCLNITNDMLNGNGIAQIVTAKKYNVNMIFNCKDIYKEIFLAYTLPRGILNLTTAISPEDVLEIACINMGKIFKKYKTNTYNIYNTGSILDVVINGNNLNIIDTIFFSK